MTVTNPIGIADGRVRPHNTNRGRRFPPDPIRVEDVAQLLAVCTPLTRGRYGELSAMRLRALIVLLYRTGIRISEALALQERDLVRSDRVIVIRHGKGDKRRIVMMDDWGWAEVEQWMLARANLTPGAIICVLRGRHVGQPLSSTDARRQLRDARARAGMRRRVNPHSFRHGFSVELWREGIDLYTLQQQLGHARLDVTAAYLRGIDPTRVLRPIGERRPPMMVIPTLRR